MKAVFVLFFAVYYAADFPGAVLGGIIPKRQTLERSKSQHVYGIFMAGNASISTYPYTAMVLSVHNELIGGGMIYKDQWIITSGIVGSNTSVSNMRVRVGSDSVLSGGQLLNVTKAINSPLYDYCVSLLKLEKKIEFGETARPIDIAEQSPVSGSVVNVTGFGENFGRHYNHLQSYNTVIYDADDCRDLDWPWIGQTFRPAVEMCVLGNSCQGDSGDPVVQDGRALGVYIDSAQCMTDGVPMYYCDLKRFYKWIDFTIQSD